MNYEKTALKARALEVRALYVKQAETTAAKRLAEYEKQLKAWNEYGKAQALKLITEALALTKKDKPVGSRLDYRLPQPPRKPDDKCECIPTVQLIDSLVELINTLSDDTISSSALQRAGIKDVAYLLRSPC